MWVKLSPEELKQAEARFKRQRLTTAICMAVLFFLLVTFFHGENEIRQTGLLAPSSIEIPDRIPGALVAGTLAGLFIFIVNKREKRIACNKCGVLKPAGDSTKCQCGGDFVDYKHLKWVKD